MTSFDQNDLARLLLSGEQRPVGAFDHLGWSTFSNHLVQLTTLHESFHSDLNNLTVYGFLLQAMPFKSKQRDRIGIKWHDHLKEPSSMFLSTRKAVRSRRSSSRWLETV